jgi:hypothetical protein
MLIVVGASGFAYKGNIFGADEAETTIATNFRGTMAVCEPVSEHVKWHSYR